jgi:hypothetical protein
MKAIRSMSKEERKAMNAEIRMQCVKMCEQFELDYDTMIAYVFNIELGYGEKRLKELFAKIIEARKELKEFYECDERNDDTHFYAMREHLKHNKIDIEKIRDEILSQQG